ncbi:uncharacterized protein TRIVIDRAFT_67261 [Trichoderma virens Gv29-8]|uniref:Uncharacterized protein n=1 Tax=Hypocrea virens (strain Gv29-8 / FGSC 10586) TaxID=413071 RepID=G9N5K5_HYPVG|nr:uncharacterized protein TRIVIDRAFT_67261 [Trichoderma virens Gv29-8]EHK18047.1 hypothetical protein TRIVIDRAFT_67261 [Trichoderma virens Gv29-8]UKZ54087.1 hypothetical protein TrVGV298_007893 [Trichoderma virens]
MDAIGLVSGILGIVDFFQSNFKPGEVKGNLIRIKAGLAQGDDEVDIEGNIAAVYAWDQSHNYMGKSNGGQYIKEGDFGDFVMDQFVDGKRIGYAAVTADKDAVCIAWITITMNDGTPKGAWTGDIGSDCGQAWYPSNEIAGTLKDSNESYFPRCTWLDGDRSGDATVAAMKFSVAAYGNEVQKTVEYKNQCHFTLWRPVTGAIAGKPGKRSDMPRKAWMENRLVVSEIPQHKASDLCNSTTSWGPDFVGSDGMFCDMHTKTLSPVCSFHDTDGCIEVDVDEKTIAKRFTVAKRQVVEKHKSYGKVSQWS